MQTHRCQRHSPALDLSADARPRAEPPLSRAAYRGGVIDPVRDFLAALRPRAGRAGDGTPEWCATIVVRSPVTKIDALAIVALAVDSPVREARTMRPYIELEGGARAEIEIPKFGEPPPLAIDVYSTVGHEHAVLEALSLMAALEQYTGWSIRPDFEV